MPYQTEIGAEHAADSPSRAFARNAGDLWHHLLMLGELQARMFLMEFEAAVRSAQAPAILVMLGCILGLAALPVLLACLALVLIEAAGLTPAAAFGIVAGASLGVSVALAAIGWQWLRSQPIGAPRSREEWRQNWIWLKETVRRERAMRNESRRA